MQKILILQCLCTIWLNIVTIILIHLVVNTNLDDNNAPSFKCEASSIGNTVADGDNSKKKKKKGLKFSCTIKIFE